MIEPLDVLAVMAHPDDAEIFCGGALVKSADAGERTGVLDLTAGEAGSRGTRESRAREAAAAAAEVLGLVERRCAGLSDARLTNDHESRVVVVNALRALRPRVVVTHWTVGRHPDHGTARRLGARRSVSCRIAELPRRRPRAHRPQKVVYALSFVEDAVKPTFVVDISGQIDRKIAALAAYGTQFQGTKGNWGGLSSGRAPGSRASSECSPPARVTDSAKLRRAVLDQGDHVRLYPRFGDGLNVLVEFSSSSESTWWPASRNLLQPRSWIPRKWVTGRSGSSSRDTAFGTGCYMRRTPSAASQRSTIPWISRSRLCVRAS